MNNLIEILGIVGIFRLAIYAAGDAHKEYNAQAIGAFYLYFIAVFRLLQLGEKIQPFDKPKTISDLHNVRAIMTYTVEQAKTAGGWVNAVGFCPVCTSFWVMALAVLPFYGIYWFGLSLLITKITFQWT